MSKLSIEVIKQPESQEYWFYERLSMVSQDLWATEESLWELASCSDCKKIISKEDMFWHSEDVRHTISLQLIQLHPAMCICPSCWSDDIVFPYWMDYSLKIRKKIRGSVKTFLVVAKDGKNEIVGFEEAYIDSFERIFRQELASHYWQLWSRVVFEEVRKVIPGLLETDPFMVLWSIWLLPRYRSLRNIHQVIRTMAEIVPANPPPCITEVDKRNVLHKICTWNGWISLSLTNNNEISRKIWPMKPQYKSDLLVFHNVYDWLSALRVDYKDLVNLLIWTAK